MKFSILDSRFSISRRHAGPRANPDFRPIENRESKIQNLP